MKKIYFLLFSFAISISAFPQALPNPSFDNWTSQLTYDDPDNWNTLNSTTSGFGILTVLKATGADVHSGAAAMELITQFIPIIGLNANGLATTGTINIQGYTVDGGIPYTLRPDSITGWYKCNPQGNDFGFVDFSLLNAAGTDTVGYAHFQTPNSAVNVYTYFSLPINYYNANTPELSRCVMSSSAGVTSVANSIMFVDDLALVFNPNGVHEPVFWKSNVKYNSVNKNLHVLTSQHSRITVVDMTGQLVFETNLEAGSTDLKLTNLQPGLYIYKIADDAMRITSVGKFIGE